MAPLPSSPLSKEERLHYRDRLRAARYAALADAEGFGEICFALEAIGLRLCEKQRDLGTYEQSIEQLASKSTVLTHLPDSHPWFFSRFASLYDIVRRARNDAMHSGAYARHATAAAIELSIGLEEALMTTKTPVRTETVSDLMVKNPVSVEPWHPVAYARQLMLIHSFSYLPIFHNGWKLIAELAMAKYLYKKEKRHQLLAMPIKLAADNGLDLVEAVTVRPTDRISTVLQSSDVASHPVLWLVLAPEHEKLSGVLSPFELM